MSTLWLRVNATLLALVLLALVTLIAMSAMRAEGGPLDPPAAPGSTSGVLLPGTPISSAPYTISAPGHYYLTQNLHVTGGQIAISVASSSVTLDLGGFSITGDGSPGSWGIRFSGGRNDVTIENGSISGFQFGVDVPSVSYDLELRRLHATANVRGFSLLVSRGVIVDCVASGNSETGIYIPGERFVVRNCAVVANGGDGISVAGSANLIESNKVMRNTLIDINVTSTFNHVRENEVDEIVLSNGSNIAIDNICGGLTGAGGTNITAATSHQNIGC